MPILTFQSPQTSVVVMLDGSFVYNNRNRVLYASHSNGQTRAKYNHHQPLYYAPPRYPLSTLLLQMAQQPDLSAPLVVSSDLHSSLPQRQSARGLQHIRSLLYLELIIAFAERRCSWCFRFAFCSSVLSFLSLRLFGFLAAGAGRKGRRQAIGQGRDIWHRPSELIPFLCSRGT